MSAIVQRQRKFSSAAILVATEAPQPIPTIANWSPEENKHVAFTKVNNRDETITISKSLKIFNSEV